MKIEQKHSCTEGGGAVLFYTPPHKNQLPTTLSSKQCRRHQSLKKIFPLLLNGRMEAKRSKVLSLLQVWISWRGWWQAWRGCCRGSWCCLWGGRLLSPEWLMPTPFGVPVDEGNGPLNTWDQSINNSFCASIVVPASLTPLQSCDHIKMQYVSP